MASREPSILDSNLGSNIIEVEEVIKREQERLEGIKKKELARITNERRRENERRRTQEIKFNREDFEQMRATQTNGTKEGPSGSVSPTGVEDPNGFSRRGESMNGEGPKKSSSTERTLN